MLVPAERMPARAAWEKLSNSCWIELLVSDGLGAKPEIAKAKEARGAGEEKSRFLATLGMTKGGEAGAV